jgi:hypothetical protein
MSVLIAERRLKTSERCPEVASDTFRNRDLKSLTFLAYRSAPVGPIAETDLTSFSRAVNSAIIDRAVAAVAISPAKFKTVSIKQATAISRVRILIVKGSGTARQSKCSEVSVVPTPWLTLTSRIDPSQTGGKVS